MSRLAWCALRAAVAVTLTGAATTGIATAQEQEKCQLMRAATFDMAMDPGGRVNVPIAIDGQNVNLLIDTGGYASMLSRATVDKLGFTPIAVDGRLATFYGGKIVDKYVRIHDAVLGGLKASSLIFFVMPDGVLSEGLGGILSPDIMRAYDVDFDFANSRFNLFSKDHCEGRVVYWTTHGFGSVKFEFDGSDHIVLPIFLDGKEVRAAIDTGAEESVASLEKVEMNSGVDEKSPGFKALPVRDGGRRTYYYPFKTLTFDDVTVNNPDLILVPDDESKTSQGVPTVILGMNILRQLHLYIAYGEKVIYVTPASAH
jgi:predicted aspartyl protease